MHPDVVVCVYPAFVVFEGVVAVFWVVEFNGHGGGACWLSGWLNKKKFVAMMNNDLAQRIVLSDCSRVTCDEPCFCIVDNLPACTRSLHPDASFVTLLRSSVIQSLTWIAMGSSAATDQ